MDKKYITRTLIIHDENQNVCKQVRNPADREHSFWLNVNTDSGSS